MIARMAVKAFAVAALVVCCIPLASGQLLLKAHGHRHSGHRPLQRFPDMQPEAMRSHQAYSGLGYGGVPENPLIPMKAEVPPPVDPTEPGSGSYGAMLEGRNPAPSEP